MRQLLPEIREQVDLDAAYALPGRPHLRANMVASADGAAQLDGHSAGLSGAADRRVLSLLRGLSDVVLVGAGTARVERYGPARPSPQRRRRRRAAGLAETPAIAVVSARLDLDPAAELFTAAERPTIVLTCTSAPADRRAALDGVADVADCGEGSVDVALAVQALYERGLQHVLCEGGPTLLGQVLAAGLLDELCLTVSPVLVGGTALRIAQGPPASAGRLQLAHLLEDDGVLFLRYTR